MIEITNEDNMQLMARYPDNFYDLAIVDPPYGLDDKLSVGAGKMKNSPFKKLYKESSQWDTVPDKLYFDELMRVSKHQIIWGGNYFLDYLGSTRGIICWDKKQCMPTFSRWELAWTSFDCVARLYEQSSMDLNRFHPTQKPVNLYRWLLSNYAKTGDKILDTHIGSASIAIACHDLGFDLTACELDKDYYDSAINRLRLHQQQQKLNLTI